MAESTILVNCTAIMSLTLKRLSESTLKKAPRSLGGRGEVLGVGKGAEVGACAWPPSQKLSISLMLSTKQSGITYTLEYFVRELSSSSTCPSRIMIRLRLLKVSMMLVIDNQLSSGLLLAVERISDALRWNRLEFLGVASWCANRPVIVDIKLFVNQISGTLVFVASASELCCDWPS